MDSTLVAASVVAGNGRRLLQKACHNLQHGHLSLVALQVLENTCENSVSCTNDQIQSIISFVPCEPLPSLFYSNYLITLQFTITYPHFLASPPCSAAATASRP